MPSTPARRRAPLAALVLLCCMALVTAACGGADAPGEGEGATSDGDGAGTSDLGPGDGDAAAFPVDIEHTYGVTTIAAEPRRIVTVGLTDQDPVLALGLAPVGVTEWFGDHSSAVWPWALDALADAAGAAPEVVSTAEAVNFEAIAAQGPDLILAVYSGLSRSDYDKLSKIAPTVAQPGEYLDYGVPWQEQTTIIGRALGRSARAEELVAEAEATLEQARGAHPEFEGATGLVASPYSVDKIAIYGPQDVRGRFMTSLGFVQPPEIGEIAGDEFSADIGQERIDLLDADALIVLLADLGTNLPVLEQQTLFTNLDAYRQGRGVYIDTYGPLGGATSFVTVLSVPFLVEGLVPRLAAAIDGDPSTTP